MPDTERAGPAQARAEELSAILRDAGQLALGRFRGTVKSWTKDHSSPVSEVDIAVNEFLHAHLDRSDTGWLSEESQDDPVRLKQSRVWVVDPIDGTRGYLAGLPDWSVSVALVEAGRPVLAGLYAPVADQMYIARRGGGATVNGLPIRVQDGDTLAGARIAGPRDYVDRVSRTANGIVTMPKVHSLALRLARVAHGQLEAAFASTQARDWDLAAADLLVHEAGGLLTTVAGENLRYNQPVPVHGALVAAGPVRHAVLLDLVHKK
ncbi:MAG: 3'(2'),5'-bisphosphate nucleotidase CysQ [Pseudorhodoplanes sp.]